MGNKTTLAVSSTADILVSGHLGARAMDRLGAMAVRHGLSTPDMLHAVIASAQGDEAEQWSETNLPLLSPAQIEEWIDAAYETMFPT